MKLLINIASWIFAAFAAVFVYLAVIFVFTVVVLTVIKTTGTSPSDALEIAGRAVWQFCVYANNIAQWVVNLWK